MKVITAVVLLQSNRLIKANQITEICKLDNQKGSLSRVDIPEKMSKHEKACLLLAKEQNDNLIFHLIQRSRYNTIKAYPNFM